MRNERSEVPKIKVLTLDRLEYDRVLSVFEAFAMTKKGKEFIRTLRPLDDPTKELNCVEEMILLKHSGIDIIPDDFTSIDVQDIIDKFAYDNVTLNPEEILRLLNAMRTLGELKRRTDNTEFQNLQEISQSFANFRNLMKLIEKSISKDGTVKDSASERLQNIRSRKKELNRIILRQVDKFIGSNRNLLQDSVYVLREGRYVFPIKANFKSQVRGIVHSSSASGATCFIEPELFIPLNNEMRELENNELAEVRKILRQITLEIFNKLDVLKKSLELAAYLDSIHARALFAQAFHARVVKPASSFNLKLVNARHPLISPENVVPINIHLPEKKLGVVLTGPNTGGKTVTLKTIGLFIVMMMSGFPLPCDEGTVLPKVTKLIVDIGDEQSIEQNLSTFSSHIANIVNGLHESDPETIVLFDELGAGTDPVEGAALSLAIIEELKKKKCHFFVTTHLTPVKIYSATDDLLISASMEFDSETMKPTYRILMGVPGASHAFEIAEKMGLDKALIDNAKKFLSAEYLDVEGTIAKYEEKAASLQKKIEELELEKKMYENMKEEYERKHEELKKKRIEELDEDLRGIYEHMKRVKKDIDQAIHDIRKRDIKALRRASRSFENEARHIRSIDFRRERVEDSTQKVEIGCTVRLKNGSAIGKVIGKKSDKYIIDFSGVRIEASASLLQRVERVQEGASDNYMYAQFSPIDKPEIDIRGLTVSEAEPLVEEFIDKLILSSFNTGYILHGKGTGRLAAGIWEILRKNSHVKRYRFGTPNEGGTGVTVVEV